MSTLTDPAPAAEAPAAVQLTYREAVTAAMHDAMTADPSVLLLGEDVGADGGVFKTNTGLIEAFGPARVRTTPICENAFVGVALGMSLVGLRPIVEIMFADFLPTAGDAIVNQLPKYRFMSGGQCSVPVTIRVIGGGTGRFGTQHSATYESWFSHLPGLRVATASTPGSAYALLRAAIASDDPTIVFEHKALYGRKGPVERGSVAEVGKAAVVRPGRDVTIVATLLMVERALAAAETLAAEGIEAEVIDLRWVRPIDLPTVRASVERTGRLVVAEEQVHAAGWGATLISELTIGGLAWAAAPRRVSLPDDYPIPYTPPLEDLIVPSAAASPRPRAGRSVADRAGAPGQQPSASRTVAIKRRRPQLGRLLELHDAAEAVDHDGVLAGPVGRGTDLGQPLLLGDPARDRLVLGAVAERAGEAAAAGVEDHRRPADRAQQLAIRAGRADRPAVAMGMDDDGRGRAPRRRPTGTSPRSATAAAKPGDSTRCSAGLRASEASTARARIVGQHRRELVAEGGQAATARAR